MALAKKRVHTPGDADFFPTERQLDFGKLRLRMTEPQMQAEQAAPQPSVQGAAPAPLPPFLQNVPEPEPEPERMPLTTPTVHEADEGGESDEEVTGLQNRREWSEQPKRERHQTWMQDRTDRTDQTD